MMALGSPKATRGSADWILDSSASHHMTGDAGLLSSFEGRPPVCIKLAAGLVRSATASRTATVAVAVPQKLRLMRLSNVLVVPGLGVPLISVRQAATAGYTIEFGRDAVVRKDGVAVARGSSTGRTYTLRPAAERGAAFVATATPTVSVETWHRRLAHLAQSDVGEAEALVGMEISTADLKTLRATA